MDRPTFDLESTINSPTNTRVKSAKALQRRRVRHKEKRFLVEGVRVLQDALRAGCVPTTVFLGPQWEQNGRIVNLLHEILAVTPEVYPVGRSVMSTLSDTVTPQGILAVCPFVKLTPLTRDLLLILDGIQDPGNFGTLLRSAEASGVDQVILAPGTVDAFNPKVVRAGAGAHFRLPLLDLKWPEIEEHVRDMTVRLAESGGPVSYYEVDWCKPTALIVSNEGAGATGEASSLASECVSIPMKGGTESLNVGVAGSVIVFEAARQRALSARTS